jgi:hypothetical protein
MAATLISFQGNILIHQLKPFARLRMKKKNYFHFTAQSTAHPVQYFFYSCVVYISPGTTYPINFIISKREYVLIQAYHN